MAARTARKPQRSVSRAKRDHARSGASRTSSRRGTTKSTKRATTAKKTFSRKKNTRSTSSSSRIGKSIGQTVSTVLTSAVAGIFVLLLLVGWGYFQYLPKLFNPENTRFVAVVPTTTESTEDTVYVAWLGSSVQQSRIWELPASLQVSLPESYGQYRLGAVYPLLTLDDRSEHYKDAVLTRSVGAVIDSHIALDPTQAGLPLADRAWHEFLVSLRSMQFAQAKIALQVWQLARQDALHQEFSDLTAVQKAVRSVRKGMYPPQCQVAVLNASKTAGEATALSQVLELNGITAIRVDTYSEQRSDSSLYIDGSVSAGCASVIAVLQSIFTQSEGITAQEDSQITTEYHAPIVVIVGDTF